VAGYLIFRSTDANFAIGNPTLIDFVRGNQTNYVDTSAPIFSRNVTITEVNPANDNNNSGQSSGRLVVNESNIALTTSRITQGRRFDQHRCD
jgi:hypothetical protein